MAFSQTVVTKSFGAGATGTVSFIPDQPISNGADFAGMGAAIVGVLDGSGNLAVAVPSNLDPGTRPANSRTRVHERVNGGNRIYYVQVPTTGPVDLDTLARGDDTTIPPAAFGDRYVMALSSTQPRVLTMDREGASASMTLVSGKAYYTAFTALTDQSISSISSFIRSTAAATITLARYGLYAVAGDGSISLLARTAASTTLGNTTFSQANAPLDTTGGYPSSYTIRKGLRYAFGCLWVATTAPAVYGSNTATAANGWLPWLAMAQTGLADLPTSAVIGPMFAAAEVCLMGAY